ncbi:hypothetical protein FOL46_002777, partial [Perkinsus olseni]
DGEVSGDGGTSGQGSKDQQTETAQETGAGLRSVAVGRNDDPPVLSLRWADEEMTMLLDSGSAASLIDRVSLDFPQEAPSERVALREMFEGRVCNAMTAEVALATGVIDCYCTNDELFLTDDTDLNAVESGLSRPSPVSDGSGERD